MRQENDSTLLFFLTREAYSGMSWPDEGALIGGICGKCKRREGRMEIDSTPGQGTRIAVWIPIEAKAGQDFLPPNPEKFKVASNP